MVQKSVLFHVEGGCPIDQQQVLSNVLFHIGDSTNITTSTRQYTRLATGLSLYWLGGSEGTLPGNTQREENSCLMEVMKLPFS